MMTFSKTDNSLTVVVTENGRSAVYSTTSANLRWDDILKALKANDQNKLVDLMSVKSTVERFTENNVEIKDGNVFFKSRPLHGLDVDRLLEYQRDGIPFVRLARFLEKKSNNTSYRAVNELYKFLEHREMTLTEKGTIIGYKGVSDNYYSIMGNTATIMVSGETDSGGHILNTVGAEIRCDRSCVCDDYRQGCSPGLHIGSLAYAQGWGPRVMIVEFDPADVVSVPDDCECQKLRACAYKVIGEYVGTKVVETADAPRSSELDEDEGCDEECDECNCPECKAFRDENDDAYESNQEYQKDKDQAFEDGHTQGVVDGKAHAKRKFYITDLDNQKLSDKEWSYIDGYNSGYRKGRGYDKS
jgi:hypothetical protein